MRKLNDRETLWISAILLVLLSWYASSSEAAEGQVYAGVHWTQPF